MRKAKSILSAVGTASLAVFYSGIVVYTMSLQWHYVHGVGDALGCLFLSLLQATTFVLMGVIALMLLGFFVWWPLSAAWGMLRRRRRRIRYWVFED